LDLLSPRTGLTLLVILGLPAAVILLHYLYFQLLPRRAAKKYAETDGERLRPYLEKVLATPSLLGPGIKLLPQLLLADVFVSEGRHAEAADHCRAVLDVLSKLQNPRRLAALEADTRRRLADCLKALGHADQAAEERRAAEELRLATAVVDYSTAETQRLLAEGRHLKEQNRYEEAYAAFLRALGATPRPNIPLRVECTLNVAFAAYKAGRPADSLHWAEQAIALGAEGGPFLTAHRMAALACNNLGRLEESEGYYRRARDLALAENDTPEAAQLLAILADCIFKQGRLDKAAETAERAAALDPRGLRVSLNVRAQVFRARGCFEEALALQGRVGEGPPQDIPASERRILAAAALDTARLEAECGRGDDAWRHLGEARAVFGNEAKLGLQCESASAWVLAARGLPDESQRAADRVEARLGDFAADPGTCRAVLYDLGMAASTRGDHDAGIALWTRYLDLSPYPVYRPTAFYLRGECHRQLGRPAESRADYQAAVATDLDTYTVGLARRRLSQVTVL
jgi:tetratricopeptide (TPR) repeat protein